MCLLERSFFPALPDSWPSTAIIFFQECPECVHVFAMDPDDKFCNVYHVLAVNRHKRLSGILGYTSGNGKLFFGGDAIEDKDKEVDQYLVYSLQIKVYDFDLRKWSEDIPELKYPMPRPFLYFVDDRLYVLSEGRPDQSHFEMLDMNDLAQGWVSLPLPSFIYGCRYGLDHAYDYTNKCLFVRIYPQFYTFSFKDRVWRKFQYYTPELPQGLFTSRFSDSSVILEDRVYSVLIDIYQMQAVLKISDLDYDAIGGGKKGQMTVFDLTHIVPPVVLTEDYTAHSLLYLGKSNSCLRFFLGVELACWTSLFGSVFTCTLEVSTDPFGVRECFPPPTPLNLELRDVMKWEVLKRANGDAGDQAHL